MSTFDRQLFSEASTVRVRDSVLNESDDDATFRQKLARIILDGMFEFVGLLDPEGRIVDISRRALDGAGVQLDDIRGKPFWEARWWAVSEELREVAHDLVRRARTGEFVRCDLEVYGAAAGKERVVIDFSLQPVRDEQGRVVFLLPEGRNITEKKHAEIELAHKNAELQQLIDKVRQLDALKSGFFANLSHELRTPLALIMGPAESMLAHGDNLTDLQRRDVGVIHRNAAMLLKQVNELLDLAKLDAGQLRANCLQVDLAHLVRTVAAHFEALAPQRSVAYEVATPATLVAAADSEKMTRIVLNLLSNAFKFTPIGGRVRCALEALGADRVLLRVSDSGPGVAPDMRPVIFDRFAQGRGGEMRGFGGTGLGLAIVKEFAELHGGTVAVSDAPEGGALFEVQLPRRSVDAPGREAGPAADELRDIDAVIGAVQPFDAVKAVERDRPAADDLPLVIVAEDNADMRQYIVEVLGADYRVAPAADGAAALALALAEPPDLVVTDLVMPTLDGDQLVRELRARPALAQLPVLMLSASADAELRLKLLAESVQDYVTKPFSPHELRARVRNLVTMKQARDALQQELATQNVDLVALARQLISNKRSLQRSLKARKVAEERVRHLAFFDATTDLPNRAQLTEMLQQAVAAARAAGRPFALLIVSLERFKEITYTLGQTHGDRLLQDIGPRIRSVLRPDDALAYCGDREFAVLCPGLGAQAASELAERLVARFEEAFELADFGIEIGANVGLAIFPGHGDEAGVLMRHAEVALYRAQQDGKSHSLYSAEQDPYNPRRLQLMGELRAGIARRELVLYCQPKLDLNTREIVALEALTRWQHPSYGLISPDGFVPLIESTGLIAPLTRWVADAALAACHHWQQKRLRVPIAINLSARNLADPRLNEYLQNALITWGAEARWIELEITESSIMVDPHAAQTTLGRLSDRGFRIVIDDFGTGWSSLAYVQKLPIDAIKIDKSFVLPMLQDRDAGVIVHSTIELGHSLGIRVIAEGVENREIFERLIALGCDEAQGYYVGPPMPVGDFDGWVKAAPWPLRANGQ